MAAHGCCCRPLILYTFDGGATWAEQPNPVTMGELQRVFFLDALDIWAMGDEPLGTLAREGYVMVNENASSGSWSATLHHTEDGGGTRAEALAVVAGGYLSNVQIVSSSGSLARREAIIPPTP